MIQSICVFCGSSFGQNPRFRVEAQALGRLIAQQGMTVVYGGGNVGLMGLLADAALQEGGKVIGIIPVKLFEMVEQMELSELLVVKDMHERKAMMQDKADAFIALPGGIGTMEELFEVWAWRYIGYHTKPVGLLNTSGYYDTLLKFLGTMTDEAFMKKEILDDLVVADQATEILRLILQKSAEPDTKLLKLPERRFDEVRQ